MSKMDHKNNPKNLHKDALIKHYIHYKLVSKQSLSSFLKINKYQRKKYNLHFNVQVTTSELEQVNMLCSYFLGPLSSSCNIEKKASGPSFFALVRDV